MRLTLAAAASLGLVLPAAATSLDVPSGTYRIDPTHASVVWKVSHLGYSTYTGMFDRKAIDATIRLDAENVANSSLEATVAGTEVVTLHPGEENFNAEIASETFLNAREHPTLSFTSDGITITGENTAQISGELTVRGQSAPFTLEAVLNRAAPHPMSGQPTLGISAVGTFDRTAYGVDTLAGPIGGDVTVEIEAEFVHAE